MVLTLPDVGNTTRVHGRYWLDYDAVAFAMLVITLGMVELLVLRLNTSRPSASHQPSADDGGEISFPSSWADLAICLSGHTMAAFPTRHLALLVQPICRFRRPQ